MGEEGADLAGTSGRTWVIDPVDGTYNFHRGLDWWCSALALVEGDDVVLGRVHHPPRRDVRRGAGPPADPRRLPLAPLEDRPLAECCATTYLHPPFYDGEVGAAFERAVAGVATLRMMGSGTMDAMAIAEGRCDVLFQHSVPDWDRLPGAAIIRGVGGESRVVRGRGRLARHRGPDRRGRGLRGAHGRVACARARQVQGVLAGRLSRPSSTSSSGWASAPTW